MGSWVKKTEPHKHDMPGPGILTNQVALPGWVWQCTCGEQYELISYSRESGLYRNTVSKVEVTVSRGDRG